jgi:hypothetical protein
VPTGSPRQLWLLPVLLITVIAVALGALVARSLYKDQPPRRPVAIESSPPSVPPSEQPGPAEVRGTADATSHPLYITLRPLLQQYFDAVNAKDYESWREIVTAERAMRMDAVEWMTEFDTSRDGSIVVYRIETDLADTAQVLLQFTSTQAVEDAPEELPETCIQWHVVWPFVKENGEWKLAAGSTSASPQHEPCTTS